MVYRNPNKNKQKHRFEEKQWSLILVFNSLFQEKKTPEQVIKPGFMPSLYSPSQKRSGYYKKEKVAGRKFYYHAKEVIEKAASQGIPIQNIKQDSIFTTKINFRNLSKAELGTLFTVLGQDQNHHFALKIGGGKPIGMGSLVTEIIEIDCPNVRDRYLSYNTDSDPLTVNLTDQEWNIVHAIARDLSLSDTDPNEVKKILEYLRKFQSKNFFQYLKILAKNADRVGHSKKTVAYYSAIETACKKHLQEYQDQPQLM